MPQTLNGLIWIMNIATISPISIQLKLINEYDPIYPLKEPDIESLCICLKHEKLAVT